MAAVTIVGAKELQRILKNIPKKVAIKAIKKGSKEGAKIIQRRAKSLAPRKTGQTRKAVKARMMKRSRVRVGAIIIVGAGDYKDDEYYASFQEYGWRQGSRKLGTGRKQIQGKHFIRNAANQKKRAAGNICVSTMKRIIEQEAKHG